MSNAIIGGALGLGMSFLNQDRQINQQRKLTREQVKAQKELGVFNREQALQLWKDTSYAEQRKQMEKAGLNVGLMYGGAGSGGTTAGAGAGNVTGGTADPRPMDTAGMAIGLGLQAEMQKAQIENTKADTEVKKVEAGKKAGVDTDLATAQTGLLSQQTTNEKVKGEILKWEEQLKIIETNIADKNEKETIEQMKMATKKLKAEMEMAVTQNKITKETADENIKQAELQNLETGVKMALMKADILKTNAQTDVAKAQIKAIAQDIMTQQVGLTQEQMKIRLQQQATGWNFGDDASTKRNIEATKTFVNIITDLIEAAKD